MAWHSDIGMKTYPLEEPWGRQPASSQEKARRELGEAIGKAKRQAIAAANPRPGPHR